MNMLCKHVTVLLLLGMSVRTSWACYYGSESVTCESAGTCLQNCQTFQVNCGFPCGNCTVNLGVYSMATVACSQVVDNAARGYDSYNTIDCSQSIPVNVVYDYVCGLSSSNCIIYMSSTESAYITCIGSAPAGNLKYDPNCNPVYGSEGRQKAVGDLAEVLMLPKRT